MNHRQRQMARAPERRAPEQQIAKHHVSEDLVTYVRRYAEEKPERFALACLGVGFILGWKLKPW
jgi:hypothetical protein